MVWRYNNSLSPIGGTLRLALVLLLISSAVGNCASKSSDREEIVFEKAILKISGLELTVEVADREEQRQRGLMFRKELVEGTGMLFVFPQERILSFWMKNTLIPLSIGYFDRNRKLVDIQKMNPESIIVKDSELKRYPSQFPAQYALEVPQGWFEKHKINLGTSFSLHSPAEARSKSSER